MSTGDSGKRFRLVGKYAGAAPVFPRANPDNVLSPPHSHWRAVVDKPVALYSRLSGYRSGSVRHSGSNRASTSLCIEPDTPDLSQETVFPGCLPLPCDQEPCVARDYRDRMSLLDLAEMTLSGEFGTAERENRKVREVVQTRDQNGNTIYQWYDQDGHLHTISEWEFKRRLSMYFQSLLEFLYPEYFGSSMSAGGGWHQWQYWKVRRTADRPENTGQQRWQSGRHDTSPTGKRQGLLRLYSQYSRPGSPKIIPAIKTISLSLTIRQGHGKALK